ncbi:MAG: PmoA family protein [Pirellulales bacterium]|nr:PmoA family protein [Pirellulales bacterium]
MLINRQYKSLSSIAIGVTVLGALRSLATEVAVEQSERGAVITIDGGPFAEYLLKSGHQPVIWPIIGPDGQAMTRQYPLGPALPGEPADHPHHRSLWFNHGAVNDLDFWIVPNPRAAVQKDNLIVHREFAALESRGRSALIVTRNDWISDAKKICEDTRTIEFGVDEHGRWIDYAIELHASQGDLTFGDTDEGSFGIRVPGTMAVDAKRGGQILTSGGQRDLDAWGHVAQWVDYHGPVDGKAAGIVMFSLPDSFRHPCRWHVRTYGLFAANPFGENGFPPADLKQGVVKLAKGDALRLHYRVLFYSGERQAVDLEAINEDYVKTIDKSRCDDAKSLKKTD